MESLVVRSRSRWQRRSSGRPTRSSPTADVHGKPIEAALV